MFNKHSFHIPVMGIGYTIDTPLKVSQYGIDSVISIVDDILLEKLRKLYCGKYQLPYVEITTKMDDFRAKRITSYLNLLKELTEKKFDQLKSATKDKSDELKKYFSMMPNGTQMWEDFNAFVGTHFDLSKANDWLKRNLSMGSIDVNIMTKLDKENYVKDVKLGTEFNDAHAALRGFANSDLTSSMVLSAGMNPRLYSYIEQFEDFYSKGNQAPKKKIVLKVSDYRSALVQGKLLAKKGLWISEFRIESGLNCGGHAFATEGFLLGPILAEFKNNHEELISTIHELMIAALEAKGIESPNNPFPIKITAQGGVGTSDEHEFLLKEYNLDSVGWGSPFLLVPEATNVDAYTLQKLSSSTEADVYLSDISPLGIPFYNLRGNSKDFEKSDWIEQGRPGSSCPKKYLSLNKEFTEKAICTASRQYQHLKLKELNSLELDEQERKLKEKEIEVKSCICVGLGTSALLVNDLDTTTEGPGVSVCPGPNISYFSKIMSLSEIIDHIYGRSSNRSTIPENRPNMFIKELDIYLEYFKNKIEKPCTEKDKIKHSKFAHNLSDGVSYYIELFKGKNQKIIDELIVRNNIIKELQSQL